MSVLDRLAGAKKNCSGLSSASWVPLRVAATTPESPSFACFTLLAATLLCTLQLPAQQARWLELNCQATELYRQGKYAECVPVVTEALKIAEATFGPDDARIGTALYNLARTDDSLGRYGEAGPLYQRALLIDEKTLGPNHLDVANCLNSLATDESCVGPKIITVTQSDEPTEKNRTLHHLEICLFTPRCHGRQREWVKVAVRACLPAKSTRRNRPRSTGSVP